MPKPRPLAPCLIDRGTITDFRDMLRALETVESVEYSWSVDGHAVSEGRGALVKLMADPESATMAVNGCLFVNVASFRYLDFEPEGEESWRFRLYGDGSLLELTTVAEEPDATERRPHLLIEQVGDDFEIISLDGEDEAEE
jgi:hypothetical protein